MANLKIKVKEILRNRPDSFTVVFDIDGTERSNTYPMESKWFEKDLEGTPLYVLEMAMILEEEKEIGGTLDDEQNKSYEIKTTTIESIKSANQSEQLSRRL